MFKGMTSQQLVNILGGLEPMELKGLALVRECQPAPGQWFPKAPLDKVIEATLEMADYAIAANRIANKLAQLKPVPVRTVSVLEFGL